MVTRRRGGGDAGVHGSMSRSRRRSQHSERLNEISCKSGFAKLRQKRPPKRFFSNTTRLYEQEPGEPYGSSRLGLCFERWASVAMGGAKRSADHPRLPARCDRIVSTNAASPMQPALRAFSPKANDRTLVCASSSFP